MTVHVPPVVTEPHDAIDAWFRGLGRHYLGRVRPDDPILRGGAGSAGWRLRTLGLEIVVVVDRHFPYSKPTVHLAGETERMPHVERDGKLCLRNPEVPSDPVMAVASALGEARQLLRDVKAGGERDDFEEDFGLYWAQDAVADHAAAILLPPGHGTAPASWTGNGVTTYVFASGGEARRWWRHRHGVDPVHLRRTATIELTALPRPDRYPTSGAELWSLVEQRSDTGCEMLGELLLQMPKALPLVLTGAAPSGRRHAVAVMLSRPPDPKRPKVHRKVMERDYPRGQVPASVLCSRYDLRRLRCQALDAANTRLPYAERDDLAGKRVGIIGCGALGSGVARLITKSGVGHLVLVDPETLGWENIRRHQLGAGDVHRSKASTLAQALVRENPDIGSIKAFDTTLQALLASDPTALADLDLVIACTGSWAANAFLDLHLSLPRNGIPAVYGWMEAHALASHAALLMPGTSFTAGYDAAGNARMVASESRKPPPVECGALTSPFGAIELAQAEALTSRLALDFLRGKQTESAWRSWLVDTSALDDAEGSWTPMWLATRGPPDPLGGMATGPWWQA